MEETSHTETWPPAKVVLGDLVEAISACRIRELPARAATIGSVSLLYALIDPKRRNRPTAAQLRDAARIAREMARDVIGMVKAAERKADQLEQRPAKSAAWAVSYFSGENSLEPIQSPARYIPSRRSSDRAVPLEVGVDSLSWVIEELDRRGAQSNSQRGERCEELGG